MPTNNNIQELYNSLTKRPQFKNLKFEEFQKDMQDENNRKELFNSLSKLPEFPKVDYNAFSTDMGFGESNLTEQDKQLLGNFSVTMPELNLRDKKAGMFLPENKVEAQLYNPRQRANDMQGMYDERTEKMQPLDIKNDFIQNGQSVKQGAGIQQEATTQSSEYLNDTMNQAAAKFDLIMENPALHLGEDFNAVFDAMPPEKQFEEWQKNPELWNNRPYIQSIKTIGDKQKGFWSTGLGNTIEKLNSGAAGMIAGGFEALHNGEDILFGWAWKDDSKRYIWGRVADYFWNDQSLSQSAGRESKDIIVDKNGNQRYKDFVDYIKEGDVANASGDFIQSFAENAPVSIAALAAGYAGMPELGLTIIGTTSYGQRRRELDMNNPEMPVWKKDLVSIFSGTIEAGSEMLGSLQIGKGLAKIYKAGGKQVFDKTMRNTADDIIKATIKNNRKGLGTFILKSALEEGLLEEGAAGVANYVLDTAAGLHEFDMNNMFSEVGKQIAYGTFAGGAFGMIGAPGMIKSQKTAKQLQQLKSDYDTANLNLQNTFKESGFKFDGEKIITLPFEQQQEILLSVINADNLTPEQKTAISKYLEQGNKLNAALVNVGLTDIETLRKKAAAFKDINNKINEKSGTVDNITIQGTADSEIYTVKSGKIILNPEGKVDINQSDKEIYYHTGEINEDGTPVVKVISSENISALESSDPKQLMQQAFIEIESEEFVRSEFGEGMNVKLNTDIGEIQGTVVAVVPDGLVVNIQGNETVIPFTQAAQDIHPNDEQPENEKNKPETPVYAPGTTAVVDGQTYVVAGRDEDGNYMINDQNGQPLDRFTPAEMQNMGFTVAENTQSNNNQQNESSKANYPLNKKGEIDFDNMTVEQTFNYLKETEGEQVALEGLNLSKKAIQKRILDNIRAVEKFNNDKYAELKKAATIQEQAKIRAKQKATSEKLTAERAELDSQLAEINALMPVEEVKQVQPVQQTVTKPNLRPEIARLQEEKRKAEEQANNQPVEQPQNVAPEEEPAKKVLSPFTKRIKALGDYINIEDYILRQIASGAKFTWENQGKRKGMAGELGLNSQQEKEWRKGLIDDKNGITIEEFTHNIWEDYGDEGNQGVIPGLHTMEYMDIKNAVIDVLSWIKSATHALEQAESLRNNFGLNEEDYNIYSTFTENEVSLLEEIPDEILEKFLNIEGLTEEQLNIIQTLNYYDTESENSGTSEPDKSNAGTAEAKGTKQVTQAELDTQELDAYISSQSHNNNPTEKQKQTGEYDKARINLQGYNITLETLKGEQRSGTDTNGKAWSVTMNNHYGELDGTIGYDGDAIDVFVGPNPKQGYIYVVDQNKSDGNFDESKVMLGFDSPEQAKAAYMSNFEVGWQGFGNITPAGENFKQWLYDGKKQRKPYSEYKDTPEAVEVKNDQQELIQLNSNKYVSKAFNRLLKDEFETEDYGIHGLIADWGGGAEYNPENERITVNETRSGTGRQTLSKKDFINDILSGKIEKDIPSIKDYLENLKGIIYEELGIKTKPSESVETKPAKTAAESEKQPWQLTKEQFMELNDQGIDVTGWYDSNDAQRVADYMDEVIKLKRSGKQADKDRASTLEKLADAITENWLTTHSHEVLVKKAVAEGKPVPADVLADYPELKQAEKALEVKDDINTPESIKTKLLSELTLPKYIYDFFNSLKQSESSEYIFAVYGKGFIPYNGEKINNFFSYVRNAINNNDKTSKEILQDKGFDISNVEKVDYSRIWFKNGIFLSKTTGETISNANYFYAGTQVSIRDTKEYREQADQSTQVKNVTTKYKNGDTVYYQGKQYVINGVYVGEQMYDLETPDGKPAFDEIDENELSTEKPVNSKSLLDVAVEQVKKNEIKEQLPKQVDVSGVFNSLNKKGEAKLSDNIIPDKVSEAQAEADAALQDFLDAFNDLKSDNLGIVDNTAEKQAKMLVAGTKMIGAYTKLGLYKFADIMYQLEQKGIQITEELLSAIKKAYGAFLAENDNEELDDIKTVRSFTINDITNNQKQQQDDTKTNSETPYKATLFEVESIEVAARNAKDSKQAGIVIERCKAVKESIDKQIEDLQLQLEAYETGEIDHEQPNKVVEKLIEKDVREYSRALAKILGYEHDTDKKGKQQYADSNIAPAGGNATFILWKPNSEYGVYVSISYDPDYNNGYDDYKATEILWRATSKANKYTGFSNQYAQPGITVGEFSKLIENEVKKYDKSENLTQKTDNLQKNEVSLNEQKFIKEHIINATIPKTNDNGNSKQRILQGSNKRLPGGHQPDLFSGTEGEERTGGNVGVQNNTLSGTNEEQHQPAGREGNILPGNDGLSDTAGRGRNGSRDGVATDEQRTKGTGGTRLLDSPALVPFNAEDNDTQSFNQSRKYNDNISAIETLITLIKENRKATPEEKVILSNYVGFGGLKDIVLNPESADGWKESNLKYREQVKRITELSSEFDKVTGKSGSLASIKGSILNAHFTSSSVIRSIYEGVQKLGFKGGRMLEPSAGIGNFITYAPERIKANSNITAVELDDLTGNILKYLHDDVNVKVSGIQDAQIPNNSQDLVISNVPFGNYKIFDKTFKGEKAEFQNRIHNYFFAKAVDMAREGGIIAFVTSKGVLDAQGNEALRKYLNENTEFLGAVRLPNNAFKNNANTEVVTDIIFLKKNTTGTKNNPDFVSIKQIEATHKDGEKQMVSVNNYFVENPQNMLGNIVAGGLYSREDYTVENKTGYDLSKAIKNALPTGVYEKVNSRIGIQANDSQETIDAIKEGNIEVTGGRVVRKEEGQLIDISINEPQAKIEHYIRLRNQLMHLIYSEYLGKQDNELSLNRRQLNIEYDTFVKKYGKLAKNALKIAKQDADGFNVLSLEVADKQDGKADIFRQRTIQPIQNKLNAESIDEAIVISLYETASVDVERISELLNMTVPEVLQKAKGKIFEQPEGGFVTREEYLSGNVKAKLRQAQEAVNKGFSEFAYNVEQLMDVIPADIPAMHIEARLGSRWIPQEVYTEFAQHLFNTPSAKIIYQKSIDAYSNNGRIETVEAHSKWGTARRNGSDILLDALHINPPKIFDTIKEFGQEKRVLNQDETKKAVDKYEEIRSEFENWVYKSEERRTLLARIYNEKYNTTVRRTYNGDHLNIAGINGVTLRKHQKDAIWMLLQNNGGIIDHLVGAGKTYIMVAGTMEMRRTGIAKKPMIIALKSTIPQIVESYRNAYPMAKILAPLEKDFTKENRRKLFSQIANNEWDVIIMSHENYGKIPHEADIQRDFIRAEMQEIEDERAELEQQGEKQALKGLEIRLKNLEARLEKISDIDKDNSLTFEQMGIDHIMVDESQQFKNLSYVTKQRGVAGLSKAEGSKRAFNLFIGIRYLQQKYGADKGTTFLSGTPISNSMVEMYLLLKYLRPGKMAELGFNSFDAWATTFASPNSDIEFTVTGDFKSKTRFREFINVPELSMLYTEIADIRTDANTPLDKPKMKGGGYSVVEIKMSDDQIEYGQRLMEFARTKDGSHIGMTLNKNQETAAMLLATNLSSKMAIDMRLINSSYDYDPNGKIAKLVDNVERIYNETVEHKGTQLIFSDLGTPKNKTNKTASLRDYMEDEMGVNLDTLNEIFGNPDEAGYKYPGIGAIREKLTTILELTDTEIDNIISESELSEGAFNVYAEVRKRLVEKGIPEEQVVFIHDYNSQRSKEKLFKEVQNGEIRIVLGSTQKLGTGVNVQHRVVAVHHLDVPWTPASMEQRNGRAIRQGNWVAKKHYGNELPIYAYATERTLDAYKYQLLQTKQRFLDQVKSGDVEERTVRESDGDSESGVGYAELVAMLSGNTDILLKAKLEQQVQKLTKSKRNYLSEVYEAQDKKQKLEERIPIIEGNIAKTTENIETINNTVKYDNEGKIIVSDINGETLVVKNDKGKVIPTERIDYGKKAVEIAKAKLDGASYGNIIKLFSQNGLDFYGTKRNEWVTNVGKSVEVEKRYIYLRAKNGVEYSVTYSETPGILLNNIQKAIENIPGILITQRAILDKANKDIIAYQEIINKGTDWEKEPELQKAITELKEVTKRLDDISTKDQQKPATNSEPVTDDKIRIGDLEFSIGKESFVTVAIAKNKKGAELAVVRINTQLSNEDYTKKVKPLIEKYQGEWSSSNKVIVFYDTTNVLNFKSDVEKAFPELELNYNAPEFQAISPIGFYSTVEKALEAIEQERGTRDQFRAMLLKNGAKQGEMDWMRFDELPEKLTKQDIQNWIDENRIEIKEVEKSDNIKAEKKYQNEAFKYAKENNLEISFGSEGEIEILIPYQGFITYDEVDSNSNIQYSAENYGVSEHDLMAARRLFEENKRWAYKTIKGDSKFSQWQLYGGENYKELLLTMPNLVPPRKFNSIKEAKAFYDKFNNNEGAFDNDVKYGDIAFKNGHIVDIRREDKVLPFTNADNFNSSHFDEPNILAHVRFNERIIEAKGAKQFDYDYDNWVRNGKKGEKPDFRNYGKDERILFIEEIQSDWAQKGREEGFAKNMFVVTDFYGNKVLKPKLLGEGYASYETKAEAEKHMELMGNPIGWEIKELPSNNIPDMPFKKTNQWVNLAMRRMIRYAAENGFDRIAWTTGEQQANRYDLSKQIDKAYYNPKTKEFGYFIKGNTYPSVYPKTNPENIEDYIGKDLTKKLLDTPIDKFDTHELKGDNLKVGGEGMKAFYDGIVPAAMSKLGKPFGANVETIDISNGLGFRLWEKKTEKYLGEYKGSAFYVSEDGKRELRIPSDYKTPEQVVSELGLNIDDVTVKFDGHSETGLLKQQSIPLTDSMKKTALAGLPLYHTGSNMQPATANEVSETVEKLLKTGLAKEVRMVTSEEISGMLEGTELLQKTELPETIEVNGVQRPTTNSNGKPIHPTEEGIRNFWRWFSNSKVVDNEGRPLVVYHGSPVGNITIFDRKEGSTNAIIHSGLKEFGLYFTTNKELAKLYMTNRKLNPDFVSDIKYQIEVARHRQESVRNSKDYNAYEEEIDRLKKVLEGQVYPVYIKIDNLATFDAKFQDGYIGWRNLKADLGYKTAVGIDAIEAMAGKNSAVWNPDAVIKDGILAKNIVDLHPTTNDTEELKKVYKQYGGDVYLLFDGKPQSIKSATGNDGTFASDNADIRYMRTPIGYIYGFVKGDTVYINSDTLNLNTPIHEFGHLWINAIEGSELYNRGAELVKDTPYWEQVNTNPNYKDLDESARTREAMAMAIGDKGESVKRNIGLFARIKLWISDVWQRIGAKFGIQNLTSEQIQNLTFNDFVDVAVSELLSGENLAERNKNTNLATPNNNNGSTEKTRLDNRRTMESEPERLPLGTLTSSDAVSKTIAGATTTNTRAGRTTNATTQREPWIKSERLKQLAEKAKSDGTWIKDINSLTDGKEHFANGTENNVYYSKNGKNVIKVNNLLFLNENDTEFAYTRDLNYFFERIAAHNQLFPEDAYNILGFTENENGEICIVMEQPYISSTEHPAIEEIESDLAQRGFTKTILGEGINQGLTGYTNGIYELTDVKPLNVLKDKSGNLHYIDLDISKTIQSTTPDKPEFTGDLSKYAFQIVQYNEEASDRAIRVSKMQRLQQIMIEKRALVQRHKNKEIGNAEYARLMNELHEEKQRVLKGLPDPTPEDDGPDGNDPKPTRTPGQSITEYATAVADWNYRQTLAKALAKASNDITGGLPPVDDDTDINGDMLRLELDQRLGGWFGRLAEGWQDNIRSVRIFLDMLREKGTKVSDYNNFYMQYTALQGKNDAHLKDFGKRFMTAINANVLNIQKFTNYVYRDIENYVFLKHGPERNEYMREEARKQAEAEGKKFHERDDYSGVYAVAAELWAKQNGVSFNPKKKGEVEKIQADPEFVKVRDKVISDYIAKFEKTVNEAKIPGAVKGETLTIDGFWSAINAATNYSLDRLVQSGIENAAEIADLKARYRFYVPLRGHEVEAEKSWQYESPDNKNVVSKAIMQAYGRKSRAEHPFAYIIQMAQTSINKANRNQLNQTMLRLARMDKSGLMSVSETWYVLTGIDESTGKKIWTETEPEFSEDHEIRNSEISSWNEKMKKLEAEGKAKRFKKGLRIGGLFIKPKQRRQHAISVYEDGIAYQVYINGNPRVSQAINELNGTIFRIPIITSTTRFISSMITSRSPQFMLTNGARDLAFASSILPSKEGARYTAQFLKNYPVAMAILANNATFDFGKDKTMYKRYLKEFEMNGAETGYSHLLELQDIEKKLRKEQKGKNYLNPITDIETLIDVIDAGNKVIENSTRLAVYITSRESGRSIERSVSDSKEVTLNFNRRGSGIMGAAHVQSLFMFVNAGVQALANFGHVYKMHPLRMSATIGTYAAVGFLLPIIINLIGGDDDEKEYMNMTDWDRQTNLCLPTGSGFAKIPLPQEMRVFFKLGDEVYKLYSGRTEVTETAMATLLSAADMIPISPLGTIAAGEVNDFGDLQRAISPDALRGVAELATNTNFMGGQIYDKYKAEKVNLPGYQKARINRVGEPRAPKSIVSFTQWLDNFTGGDDVRKGKISLNPDIVNHLAKSYLGGMYSLIAEGEKSFTKRFYTSNADIEEKNTTVKDYYNRIDEADELIRQEKGYYEQWQSGKITEVDYNAAVDQKQTDKAYEIHDYNTDITNIERLLKTGELTPDDELYYKNMSDSLKREVIRIKLK